VELTGLTLAEKTALTEILFSLGMPTNNEGKDDFGILKAELLKKMGKEPEKQNKKSEAKKSEAKPKEGEASASMIVLPGMEVEQAPAIDAA